MTYVRYGDKVDSSLIEKGEADLLLAFEQLEAARWLPYLKPGGVLIASTQRIDPMPVIMGKAAYPEDILQRIRDKGVQVVDVDALALALEAGSVRSVNVVLLGSRPGFWGLSPTCGWRFCAPPSPLGPSRSMNRLSAWATTPDNG